jgi:hypothetical protein
MHPTKSDPRENKVKALRIILLALVFVPLQVHAGLLDDLGSALGGGAKKESPKPDTTSATNNLSRNLVYAPAASTGKRIALVIGNGNYHYDNLPKLPNPTHDAEDIAKALCGFGFEVIERKDQSLESMNEAITEFGRKITDSDAALFYFAGHGLQVKGQNYLVPTNARIESESQVPYQSVNVNQLLDEMGNGKSRANIVMLDVCRNNPISGKFRSGATRGLAAPTSQPKGTVIVYATDPGNVAADGKGRNGLFTALAQGRIAKLRKEAAARVPSVGQTFKDCPGCPEMIVIPKGSFDMGSNNGDSDEKPTHRVTIGRSFAMGKAEVTQGQWKAIMGGNPSEYKNCGDTCPVEQVSWNDAQRA